MPGTAILYVPRGAWVNVRAFTNASFNQRVTITPETGSPTVLVGSGEHDTPMPDGNFHIETRANSGSPLGYKIIVSIESQTPGGDWRRSQVSQGSCGVMYYHLEMVVSEDYLDQDWNDAVVQFTWWIPPSVRDPADSLERLR